MKDEGNTVLAATFSADGKSVFYSAHSGADSTVWRQPVDGGAAVKVANLQGRFVTWLRPSPDGKRLGLNLSSPTSEAVLVREVH